MGMGIQYVILGFSLEMIYGFEAGWDEQIVNDFVECQCLSPA